MQRARFAERRKGNGAGDRNEQLRESKISKQLTLAWSQNFTAHERPNHQPKKVGAEHARERINAGVTDIGQKAKPDNLVGYGDKTGTGKQQNQGISIVRFWPKIWRCFTFYFSVR